MKQFQKEIEANFDTFWSAWKTSLNTTHKELAKNRRKYLASYRRLVSLQAWRSDLLESQLSEGSFGFFLEAQNDGPVSHVLACLGSWRSALKALRSCIENTLLCLYYMDHPVELQLWHLGKHRQSFSDLGKYFQKHPRVLAVPSSVSGLQVLHAEYSKLSHAVHASASSFRMTADARRTLLWSGAKGNLGKWSTRERLTIQGLNLLLLTMFADHLQGTRLRGLRKAVSLAIPGGKHAVINSHLSVKLMNSGS